MLWGISSTSKSWQNSVSNYGAAITQFKQSWPTWLHLTFPHPLLSFLLEVMGEGTQLRCFWRRFSLSSAGGDIFSVPDAAHLQVTPIKGFTGCWAWQNRKREDIRYLDDMVRPINQPTLEGPMSRFLVMRDKMPPLCKLQLGKEVCSLWLKTSRLAERCHRTEVDYQTHWWAKESVELMIVPK